MSLDLSGGRYVFFKSLSNTKNPEIKAAYNNAAARLSATGGSLKAEHTYEKNTEKHMNNIETYLNFIHSMINSLKSNEEEFLINEISQLPPEHELYKLLNGLRTNQVQYQEIMTAFNTLMQNKEQYQESLERQKQNMTTIKNTMNKIESNNKDLYNQIKEEFEVKYGQYVRTLMSNSYRFNAAETKQYQQSLTRELAERVNTVLKTLDNAPEILNAIEASIRSNSTDTTSTDNIKNIIINMVVENVINTPLNVECDNITNTIINKLTNETKTTLNNIQDIEFSRIISKDFKELEEIALTMSGPSLGEHILTLDATSIKNIKHNYPEAATAIDALYKAKKKTSKNELSKLKGDVTRKLKDAILVRVRKALNDPTITSMTRAEFASKLKNTKNLITETSLRGGLEQALRGIKVTHDQIGEILASNDVRKRIVDAIVNNIPGISLSFKADIRFATGAINPDIFKDIDINSILNSVIKDNYSSFLLKYKDKGGGQTDVRLAMQAYEEQIAEMKTQIDEMIDLNNNIVDKVAAKNKAYEELYKTFSVSISVKDYDLYNNILGFHGGSLGGQKSPEQVLNNITAMYELGGLTKLDTEALLFAVINCGDAMIGSGLRPALENYLVGGAALIMFDDSFAASDEYLKRFTDSFKGQKIVNIYRLNTKYVPASYVLEGIYQDLIKIYNDLTVESSIESVQAHSRVTIINPVTEEADPQTGTLESRWNTVSQIAQSSIRIQFSFMGGLLDTLGSIPSAFNQ